MNILKGNVYENPDKYRGWIAGYFIEENSPLKTEQVEIKWIYREKGIIKEGLQTDYDIQTIVILLKGKMSFRFPSTNLEQILSKEGDFISFNSKDDSHETEALRKSKAIVIRWPSIPQK
jgi:hypothetical protein